MFVCVCVCRYECICRQSITNTLHMNKIEAYHGDKKRRSNCPNFHGPWAEEKHKECINNALKECAREIELREYRTSHEIKNVHLFMHLF